MRHDVEDPGSMVSLGDVSVVKLGEIGEKNENYQTAQMNLERELDIEINDKAVYKEEGSFDRDDGEVNEKAKVQREAQTKCKNKIVYVIVIILGLVGLAAMGYIIYFAAEKDAEISVANAQAE